ncbi:MAG: hypothetical protein IKR91_06155, partial [Alloprevotella sp.]|nr:hypothetical protein [Alloprevotella sp.]
MKEKLIIIYAVPIAVIASIICLDRNRYIEKLENDINRLSVELAHAQIPLQRDTIHDSIEVVTQTVVEVIPKKLKEALAADEQLIKELKLKVKQLESVQTTSLQIADSVPAQYKPVDSLFYYSDQWADLSLNLKDTIFYYNIRDSLSTLVYREYRHHFLWWRWGTKGYRLKIVNFNPHSRVTYNK